MVDRKGHDRLRACVFCAIPNDPKIGHTDASNLPQSTNISDSGEN